MISIGEKDRVRVYDLGPDVMREFAVKYGGAGDMRISDTEAEMALCDMVGQHCCSSLETENGATTVDIPMESASEGAIDLLLRRGYLVRQSEYRYQFTEKSGCWGPSLA